MKSNPFSAVCSIICSMFTAIFGRFSWQCPSWLAQAKHSPRKFFTMAITSIALIGAGIYGYFWYQHLPKPVLITANITSPDITPNAETLTPNPLVLNFGIKNQGFTAQSVAPLNMVGKYVEEGIEMSPQIPGKWFWTSDSQLTFNPEADWPAGQKYKIHFAKNNFSAGPQMASYDFYFSTKAFTATINEFKLYQDPVNPEVRNAVASIEFNFPVNPESLEKNTSLALQSTDKNQQTNPIKFTYSYDDNKRVAYLHSDHVDIKDLAQYLLLTLKKNLIAANGPGHLDNDISKNLLIPDAGTFLNINNTSASIIRNDKDRPEQILSIETSLGVNESDFNKSVHVYLLPQDYPETAGQKAIPNYVWKNPGEVHEGILAVSTPLMKEAIPAEHSYSTLHSFKFNAPTPRFLYVKIDKGMKGQGNFKLKNNYATIIPVPDYPKEISFLHKGSLLALGGEKKLSVLVRGVPAVKFNFARVLPNNINQLVTQTQGDFNSPYFINTSFTAENISQISSDIQHFDGSDLTKQQYTALDIEKYLSPINNPTGPQGLFLLTARGWDEENNQALNVESKRLVLVTDLGLIVKDNHDNTHDVYVASITQGTPVANASISILGKNGLPILTRSSDAQGRVSFPNLKDFVEDREPTVYIANLNNDVSFIPYNNRNRQLNFTKFDISGIYTSSEDVNRVSAFVFSDRGIYRPGDDMHVGFVVKQSFAQAQPAGLPLQATILDPRGNTVKNEKLTLNDSGLMALDFKTSANAPTGAYTINLYLTKNDQSETLLGTTSVRVSEFQPDRMKIHADFTPKTIDGWISPTGLKATVNLWNLYGSPAVNRRISAKLLLTPQKVEFAKYPDYVFVDPLIDPKKPGKVFTDELKDHKTNDKGVTEFDLKLDRFAKATYQLTFFTEGFEAEGGRSVTTQIKTLVSPLAYFIGYKPDGDLSFIKQNSSRSVNYIAVTPQLTKEDLKDLKIQLISLRPVSTLVKKPDGTLQYQSIIQSTIVSTNDFHIEEQGTNFTLPTNQIGDFAITVLDKNNAEISTLKFTVVGASQTPLAKNAELSVKLNKAEFNPNEDIELQITAPYTGSGLITIERDKVYASQWFKTDTTNSVQKIRIPAEFQGNGYVNVSFIRDWSSPEIFTSPLSYSVVPFTVNHDAHDIKIDLKAAEVSRPGEPLTINYQSNKPGKIIVFAVDEGILQVARYNTPDPLEFFFQKHALEVLTQQTVDQILPKFIQDRELSAVGGDGGEEALAGRLNPFKRKTDLPVVFWSGIVDTDSTEHQLTYNVPDYFNGSIRIMAVAVAADAVGSTDTSTQIRGDFIINPNVPTFVAPGDQFEVTASIANNLKNSGDKTPINISINASPELEIVNTSQQSLVIKEGQEQTVRFFVRAKSSLGDAKVTITATAGKKSSHMSSSLSIRPANPFVTYVQSGMSTEPKKSLSLINTLYPEYRQMDAVVAKSPLILVFGLAQYLDNFPYGCTEQLTSKALPLLAINNQGSFNKDAKAINDKLNQTMLMLSQRQMTNGSFAYWPGQGDNENNTYITLYAVHFLTEAKEQGFNIPTDAFYNALNYLKSFASQNASSMDMARNQAYAIYLLTRNEIVTSNYINNLLMYLEKDKNNHWQNDLTGVYIAGSYYLLKNSTDANQLINQYKPQQKVAIPFDFYDSKIADAQYLYVISKHFPNVLAREADKLIMEMVKDINNDQINTVFSGYASLALGAYHNGNTTNDSKNISMIETLANQQEKTISVDLHHLQKHALDANTQQISINNPDKQRYFYQLIQAGFDKAIPTEPIKQDLEIIREYRDAQGHAVQTTPLGSEIEVHLKIRALNNKYLTNIVIEDLLPGGFEVVTDSLKVDNMDYFDAREDRVNFFGPVEAKVKEIVYKIKATAVGTYTVPPAYAEAMYNPNTKARSIGAKITVTKSER